MPNLTPPNQPYHAHQLTFMVRAHQAWCIHLKWACYERTRPGALRPFKFSVHSCRGLEL